MTLRRYERYKDSGVEWLGAVPAHWKVVPLKHVADFRSGGTPDKGNLDYWDGTVPWASAKDLKADELFDTTDHITSEALAAGVASILPANSVLVVVRGMILARAFPVACARVPMAINQDLKAVIPRASIDAEYLAWLLRGSEQETLCRLDEAGHGTKALRMDSWAALPVPVPSLNEQRCIASFIGREAAKIDTLIAEQQRLIELLNEKRHALIAHAVTKGLNPAAPMKDSGVEWLGEVPGHWRVVPVKYLADVGNGSTPHRDRADYWTGGDYPWLSSTVVNGEVVLEAGEFVTELALTECHLPKVKPPAVLVGITGQGKTRGMAALLGIEATINQHIAFVRPRDNSTSAEFLRRYFETAYQRMRFESDGVGSTKGAITCEQISNMRVPMPPPEERDVIVAHLSHVTSELDRLALEARTAIELLRERRTALISAAVTGQIDVRSSTSVESALSETRADIAADRYVVESAAAHVARVQAMAGAEEHSASPPDSC